MGSLANTACASISSWATVRDKIVHGELDAAHALAAMPLAATLGLGSIPCHCLTGLVLNLHGNAITLSRHLWLRGVRDGDSLRREIIRRRREKKFTFGAVAAFSSHYFLLRKWLVGLGIHPDALFKNQLFNPSRPRSPFAPGRL